jgi:hypothetical protein
MRAISSMRLALRLHRDSLCSAATQIEVKVTHERGGLGLSYSVTGRIGDLRLPPVVVSARTDELWRRTCFEAFVRPSPGETYYEFNFSPSTQWAAYRFIPLPSLRRKRGRQGRGMAARSLGGDRRKERPKILLGVGASARSAGFSSCRLLCVWALVAHVPPSAPCILVTAGLDQWFHAEAERSAAVGCAAWQRGWTGQARQ